MKILHTSDLHLNSKMNSRLDAMRAKERKRELLLNFRSMTDYALREGCLVFIIAGDLFDTEKISESIKKSVLDIISSASEIKFLYLPGNHEKESIRALPSLPENLFVFGDDWTYFDFCGVRFAGRAKTSERMFDDFEKGSEGISIAILHGELKEHSDTFGGIGRRELLHSGIRYLALGHYHSYEFETLGADCVAVYSGTPAGRGFDESGDKGFVIIDTDGKNVNFNFQKSGARRLRIKKIDIDGSYDAANIEERISKECRDIPKEDFLRVELVGKRSPEARVDLASISERFSSGYYYFEIKDSTRVKISAEDYIYDKSLKGEFIRLVISDDTLSEDEKSEIITSGVYALMGEKFDD